MTDEEDVNVYVVVMNDEEQYSIWRADRSVPAGWKDVGVRGSKSDCLGHIEKVWTDMRPLSVRHAADAPAPPLPPLDPTPRAPGGKNDLVARLESVQPIAFVGRPESSRKELEAQIKRGRVFVRFEKTGTELGIKLSAASSGKAGKALEDSVESIPFDGELVLNSNRVRFVGTIELGSMKGTGKLEFLETESKPN